MKEKNLFEYAVIRIVPQVYREEFLNTGVILYCAKEKFLQIRFHLNEIRIAAFAPKQDIESIRDLLSGMKEIVEGKQGTIGKLPVAERFRWLTATRSSIVQCSKVHPGLCVNASEMLEKLFVEMVTGSGEV